MKQYLESEVLMTKINDFWSVKKPIGAICHGVLLLGRTKGKDGKSVVHDRKLTTLPNFMENFAYYLTKWSYGDMYKTYAVQSFVNNLN
jgi:putative intracellular protease/amidase